MAGLAGYRDRTPGSFEQDPEFRALKRDVSRMLIGDHPRVSELADRYLTLEDFMAIRERMIGSGRIGGKAAGMLIAGGILASTAGTDDPAGTHVDHDSFYIGSDVFTAFLAMNDPGRLDLELSGAPRMSPDEFPEVEARFLAGRFPTHIRERFETMLDHFGPAPLIVRSSSLLEDGFEHAFAGKYPGEFCVNRGAPGHRLEAFERAVKRVYAGVLSPAALSYRRTRGLVGRDERMAVLVQRVHGTNFDGFFFPAISGVAYSRNLYAWTNRIDPAQGVIRLVFGLGTRAVNRTGDEYPRMIAVSHPRLRPELGLDVVKYSQRKADVLDLERNEFTSVPVRDLLSHGRYPAVHLFTSVLKDGYLAEPYAVMAPGPSDRLVLTFNSLVSRTPFVPAMGAVLEKLECAYGHPVNIEFTASVDARGGLDVTILRCRPLQLPGVSGELRLPEDVPPERTLFKAHRVITGGVVDGIRYIVYIDPRRYAAAPSETVKRSVGRVVGRLNNHPLIREGNLLMMGPGRWGSGTIDLGVNVTYGDIDNAAVLVEIARADSGRVPEVSCGTHFFQDLVETGTICLPVYPDGKESAFNESFFEGAPNILTDLLPEAGAFRQVVRVIDVVEATGGSHAVVAADPHRRAGICYLD